MSKKVAISQAQKVRFLYKAILKLHRGLPVELQSLGNEYARDEFKRHKQASSEHVQTFMIEWTNYAITLTKQLGIKGTHLSRPLGESLSESALDALSNEQVYQLFELYKESTGEADVS